MTPELAKELTDSIRVFYEDVGAAFARTRGFVKTEEASIAERIKPGMTVADIGAGNGRFAKLVPEGATYIGIEPSDALRQSAAKNLDLRPGDLSHLPIPDAISDVTVCFAVLQHLPGEAMREQAIDELVRITKPGGLIAVHSWFRVLPDPQISPVEDGDPGDMWITWKAEGADTKRYVHLMQPEEWNKLWSREELVIERIGLFGKKDWTEDPGEARKWLVIARRK
jgi:tRNA (uracil-5-)-methyltransferase TRM9